MASPIANYIVLTPGIPVTLHFTDHAIQARPIEDPVRKVQVTRESLLFYVNEMDGTKVDKMYSVVSQKHAAEFAGYLPGKRYVAYRFTVIKDAPGFVPPRIVSVKPL